MKARRWKLLAAQRADMWNRWKAGQSLHEIGRALGKSHVVIRFLLARHGGIALPVRRRSPWVLTLAEREDISRGIACGSSMRAIARRLSRACSTVTREVARHGGRAQYRANKADQQAWEWALRSKACLLALHEKLRTMVASKLMQDWSPEQISGWLQESDPKDENLRVSHETIYRSLFIQARGALKQELMQHLRSQRRIRRSRHSRVHGHSQGQIVDAGFSETGALQEFENLGTGPCVRLSRAMRLEWLTVFSEAEHVKNGDRVALGAVHRRVLPMV